MLVSGSGSAEAPAAAVTAIGSVDDADPTVIVTDSAELAVVRRANGLEQLEFPMGHVVYRTSGFIGDIRVSPSGDRIVFADHPLFADDAGGVSMVDRAGTRTVLAEGFIQLRGVAWSPNGEEVWFTGTRALSRLMAVRSSAPRSPSAVSTRCSAAPVAQWTRRFASHRSASGCQTTDLPWRWPIRPRKTTPHT